MKKKKKCVLIFNLAHFSIMHPEKLINFTFITIYLLCLVLIFTFSAKILSKLSRTKKKGDLLRGAWFDSYGPIGLLNLRRLGPSCLLKLG